MTKTPKVGFLLYCIGLYGKEADSEKGQIQADSEKGQIQSQVGGLVVSSATLQMRGPCFNPGCFFITACLQTETQRYMV